MSIISAPSQSWGGVRTSQIMSYYPKYVYLDDVLSLSNKKNLNIYIDLKGCMQSLFQEWAVKYILNSSTGANVVDTCIFASVMEFIAFHKKYAKKRNISVKQYFFLESGKSQYHLDIYKDYKSNRKTGEFFGLDDCQREMFYKVLDKNYHVIDRVCNKIPDVSVFRLMYLEADFLPHFLMNNVLPKEDVDNSVNIIYSSDKDMTQCLDSNNKFQFCKNSSCVKMIQGKDIFKHVFKVDIDVDKPSDWFCLALAVVGDVGDGFKGISGIGALTLAKVFSQLITICGGSMEKIYDNISKKNSIFDKSYVPNNNSLKKIIENEDIVVRNLKLLSFKMLSDHVEGGFPTHMIDIKNQIVENVNNKLKAPAANTLYNALMKTGLTDILTEQTVSDLF